MSLNSHVENMAKKTMGNTKLKTFGKDRLGHASNAMC